MVKTTYYITLKEGFKHVLGEAETDMTVDITGSCRVDTDRQFKALVNMDNVTDYSVTVESL